MVWYYMYGMVKLGMETIPCVTSLKMTALASTILTAEVGEI